MSSSFLINIYIGRFDAENCARSILSLESPNNARNYLSGIHKICFSGEDQRKREKWDNYFGSSGMPAVTPIMENDIKDNEFMVKQSRKLSFDISRFIEFLAGYTLVHDDIKPIMLHYSAIYLLDFYARTWLKYERGRGHGIKQVPCQTVHKVKFEKSGIFPRAVDAFYLLSQSNLFSLDNDSGIRYQLNADLEPIFKRIDKMKYSEEKEISLDHLFGVYEELLDIEKSGTSSVGANLVLVGYAILFIISSISRYRSEDWSKIQEDRDFKTRIELLQHDFIYNSTPYVLNQTIIKASQKIGYRVAL